MDISQPRHEARYEPPERAVRRMLSDPALKAELPNLNVRPQILARSKFGRLKDSKHKGKIRVNKEVSSKIFVAERVMPEMYESVCCHVISSMVRSLYSVCMRLLVLFQVITILKGVSAALDTAQRQYLAVRQYGAAAQRYQASTNYADDNNFQHMKCKSTWLKAQHEQRLAV